MADRLDTAIASVMQRAAAKSRLPLQFAVSSGRVVAIDVPADATSEELADLAAMILGPVRAQCYARRAAVGATDPRAAAPASPLIVP